MTDRKIIEVVERYEKWLVAATGDKQQIRDVNRLAVLDLHKHALWMCRQIRVFLADKWGSDREKAFRWLGFVQGVLWATGVYTIDEMRDHNREPEPDPEPTTKPDVEPLK